MNKVTALQKNNLKRYFRKVKNQQKKFVPNRSDIPLAIPPYGWEEVSEVLDSLLSMKTTMGDKVKKFEKLFANYIGVKYALMVNSGSSANLITIAALKYFFGDGEIIVPPLTWVSDIASIIQNGYKPVFADINPRTLCMDDKMVMAKLTNKTSAFSWL